jgi:predicted amidohydrolase YtcJ
MKKKIVFLFLFIFMFLASGCASKSQETAAADLILSNGFIYTVDAGRTTADAVAVKDGKIIFVGSTADAEKYKGDATKVIDLKRQMVLPSFFEGHGHAQSGAELLYSCDLSSGKDLASYLKIIEDFMKAHPEATAIKGSGWTDPVFSAAGPNKNDLDAICKKLNMDIPIALLDSGHHSLWVNSKALEIGKITKDTPNPSSNSIIQHDSATGEPSGALREGAADLVLSQLPDYSVEQYEAGIKSYQDMAHSLGFTGVLDPLLPVDGNAIKAYKNLAKNGELTMRIRGAYATAPAKDFNTQLKMFEAARKNDNAGDLFQMTTIKFFMDGVIEGATAYLAEPYTAAAQKGDNYRSEPLWPQEALNKAFAEAEKANFQIHVHAIGDAAVHEALNALSYAQDQNGSSDYRNAITHDQLVEESDFARFKELGVIAVVNPYWAEKDDYYYGLQLPFLGQERADKEYPVKSFISNGVMIATASDFPVTNPPDPLTAIELGVTRITPDILLPYVTSDPSDPKFKEPLWPEESASLEEMIASATYNGAYANFLESVCGSIEVGKSADMVILDHNLFKIKPSEISKSKVLLTLFEGKEVYRADSFKN